jgi:hypothetical protein
MISLQTMNLHTLVASDFAGISPFLRCQSLGLLAFLDRGGTTLFRDLFVLDGPGSGGVNDCFRFGALS